jgi:tetratricopeptide (TPR) repeat protein
MILGYVYRSSGEPEPARAMYAHVLSKTDLTSDVRAWALRQRAYTQVQTGEPGLALADAEEALRLDPLSASSLAAASRALEVTGRFDDAIERSTQAIALNPSNWRYQQRIGILLAKAGRVAEGAQHLEQACEMGGNQESCANHAVVLARAGRADEAANVARHAASLTSSRFGLYNLACYRTLAGDHAAAIDALRGALDLGFADVLIETDRDLEGLRQTAGYAAVLAGVEDRVRRRRQMSLSTFPWQG